MIHRKEKRKRERWDLLTFSYFYSNNPIEHDVVVLNHNIAWYCSLKEMYSMFPVLELGQAFVTVPMYRFQWKRCRETSEIWLEKATQLLLTYVRTLTLGVFANYWRSLTILRKPCRKSTRRDNRDTERYPTYLSSSCFRLTSSGPRT